MHLRRAAAVADLLGIPAGVTQVSLIPVAYTKGLDFKPAKRPPVTEITYWDRWDDSVAWLARAPAADMQGLFIRALDGGRGH